MEFVNFLKGLALLLLVAAGLMLIGSLARKVIAERRRTRPDASPLEIQVLAWADVWSLKAIILGYHMASKVFNDLEVTISGADRQAIARDTYNLFPTEIDIGGVKLNPRDFITYEDWEAKVENSFQSTKAFFQLNENRLRELIEEVIGTPPAPPTPPLGTRVSQMVRPPDAPIFPPEGIMKRPNV